MRLIEHVSVFAWHVMNFQSTTRKGHPAELWVFARAKKLHTQVTALGCSHERDFPCVSLDLVTCHASRMSFLHLMVAKANWQVRTRQTVIIRGYVSTPFNKPLPPVIAL
jgi:hypothetical protein